MLEVIKRVINNWDPIGLMMFAPPDEYDYECQIIFEKYAEKQEPLDKIIYDVFKDNFGDTFRAEQAECLKVAGDIEKGISKSRNKS